MVYLYFVMENECSKFQKFNNKSQYSHIIYWIRYFLSIFVELRQEFSDKNI
jgi:hypothetical protein